MNSGRIALNEAAKRDTKLMLQNLLEDEGHVRLNASKLVSWIVCEFYKDLFEKKKEVIKKTHFNHKEFLKKALSEAQNEDDLKKVLENALHSVSTKHVKRRKRKVSSDQKIYSTNQI